MFSLHLAVKALRPGFEMPKHLHGDWNLLVGPLSQRMKSCLLDGIVNENSNWSVHLLRPSRMVDMSPRVIRGEFNCGTPSFG